MQLELAQIPLVDGAPTENLHRILDVIKRRAPGTDVIAFPETALSGFPTQQNIAGLAESIDGPSLTRIRDATRQAEVGVVIGFAERDGSRFFNTAAFIDDKGSVAMRYRKTHLWASDVGVFEPGDHFDVCEFRGVRLGLLICYDIEFPETARTVASLGAELLIAANGNMDPFGKVHRRAIVARAMENQVFAALVNRVGTGDGGLTFPGESQLVDPFGDVAFDAAGAETVMPVRFDVAQVARARKHYQYLNEARIALHLDHDDRGACKRALLIPPSS